MSENKNRFNNKTVEHYLADGGDLEYAISELKDMFGDNSNAAIISRYEEKIRLLEEEVRQAKLTIKNMAEALTDEESDPWIKE